MQLDVEVIPPAFMWNFIFSIALYNKFCHDDFHSLSREADESRQTDRHVYGVCTGKLKTHPLT